jgi:hypothetical protein
MDEYRHYEHCEHWLAGGTCCSCGEGLPPVAGVDCRLPVCPLCSSPPRYLLGGGRQAFCGEPGCRVVTWDPTSTMDEFMAEAMAAPRVTLLAPDVGADE